MPDFELYIRGANALAKAQTVTITTSAVVSFSASAYEALGSPEAVAFLIDRDEQLIGFRAAHPAEDHAYRVRSENRVVTALALLRYMNVDYSTSRRYPLLTDDGTPHIDLKQPGTPVTSNRRKH